MGVMRPYLQVLSNTLAVSLTYRWNVVAGLGTQLVQLLTSLFLWQQIFGDQPQVARYTYGEMAAYLVLTSLVGVTFSPAHIFRLPALIRQGRLNSYLVRPYSFLGDAFAGFVGGKAVEVAITGLIALGLWLAGLLHLRDVSPVMILLVICNALLLFLFGSALGFWLVQMWPFKPLYHALMTLMGGALFPLDLLPEGIAGVLQVTPFGLFGFVNVRALQGALSHLEVGRYLTASLAWSGISLAAYLLLWQRGLQRYEGVNA